MTVRGTFDQGARFGPDGVATIPVSPFAGIFMYVHAEFETCNAPPVYEWVVSFRLFPRLILEVMVGGGPVVLAAVFWGGGGGGGVWGHAECFKILSLLRGHSETVLRSW